MDNFLENTIWGLFQSTGMLGYYMFLHDIRGEEQGSEFDRLKQ